MELAVISDLHIGRGDRTDPFRGRDTQLLGFLDFLERQFERIILLGDIFETLHARWPGHSTRELSNCLQAHPAVAQRLLNRNRYRYIFGNHDLPARVVLGARAEEVLDADGMRILFLHGHLFDRMFQRPHRFTELSIWLAGMIKRSGMHKLHRLLSEVDNRFHGVARRPDRCSFQRWALQLADRRGADSVVTGHTHQGRVVQGRRLYLNSGCCFKESFEYLSLDTRQGRFAHNVFGPSAPSPLWTDTATPSPASCSGVMQQSAG